MKFFSVENIKNEVRHRSLAYKDKQVLNGDISKIARYVSCFSLWEIVQTKEKVQSYMIATLRAQLKEGYNDTENHTKKRVANEGEEKSSM